MAKRRRYREGETKRRQDSGIQCEKLARVRRYEFDQTSMSLKFSTDLAILVFYSLDEILLVWHKLADKQILLRQYANILI